MARVTRKSPRLATWDYTQPGWYFITFCTKGHRCMFGSVVSTGDSGTPAFVSLSEFGVACRQAIEESVGKFPPANIEKSVIMPNHVHLVVSVGNKGLDGRPLVQRLVGFVKSETSKTVHRVYPGRDVWQRSFFDHVIRDEEDFQRIWQYIDDNPQKWALDRFYR